MRTVYIILLLCSVGCASAQLPFGEKSVSHTEVKKIDFDIQTKELVWSRLHSYLHLYLGYPITRPYNPYIIQAGHGTTPRIIIAREIDQEKMRIIINYTDRVKTKIIGEASERKQIKDPNDVLRMTHLIDDMIEYARRGKHAVEKMKEYMLQKRDAPINDREHFFFY